MTLENVSPFFFNAELVGLPFLEYYVFLYSFIPQDFAAFFFFSSPSLGISAY